MEHSFFRKWGWGLAGRIQGKVIKVLPNQKGRVTIILAKHRGSNHKVNYSISEGDIFGKYIILRARIYSVVHSR